MSSPNPSPFVMGLACVSGSLLGCDQGGEAPQKSRVQAVLAEPGTGAAGKPEAIAPAAEPAPAPAKPRAPLCQGQLDRKSEPFRPKRAPTQLSMAPAPQELPNDPLQRGKKTKRWTWVNFWAAWCVPCKEELPLLLGWREQLAQDIEFVFVSLDDDERQLREFLERQPATGLQTTYWLPDGPTRAAWLEALELTTEPELPLQLLVDGAGSLRCKVEGAVEASDLAALQRIARR